MQNNHLGIYKLYKLIFTDLNLKNILTILRILKIYSNLICRIRIEKNINNKINSQV
jgi:hypothetical protein